MNNVFVYCETEGTNVADVSLELLTKGRKLANQLGCGLEAIVAGSGLEGVEKQVLPFGVDKVHVFDAPGLFPYTSLPHSSILINLFKEEKPQICLMGATVIGRDLGPRVSSALTSGLTADCTSLEIGSHEDKKAGITYENLLYQIRPAFGGNIVATIINPEHRPQMATVREGVMKKEVLDENYKGEVIRHDVAKYVPETDYVVKVIDRHVEKAKHNLKGAPIVVAGGYGVGSKENFNLLFDLAKELHAEVGASRAAVDAGFCDHDRQIGQTGVTVRPKLYIACGISGQIQHIAGMQDAGIIISINNDENAPINTIADYVINGTVEEVIPKMIQKAPDFEPAVSPDGLVCHQLRGGMAHGAGRGRFPKGALPDFCLAGGAGKLVAQPAPAGFTGGPVLWRWSAAGGVSEKQKCKEIPPRHGVWFCPMGNPRGHCPLCGPGIPEQCDSDENREPDHEQPPERPQDCQKQKCAGHRRLRFR